MASQIKAVPGYNNPGGLSVFPESPDTDGVLYPREIIPANQFVYDDGFLFCDLRFPDIVDPLVWVECMGKCGLSIAVKSAYVTVRLPDADKVIYRNYNGIAVRPERTPFAYCWYTGPVIRIRKLVAI